MTGLPPEPPAGTTIGPLAQEAALLLDVVADRLEQLKSRPTPQPGNSSSADVASAQEPPVAEPSGPESADEATGSEPGPASSSAGQQAPVDQESAAGADGRCPECGSVPGAYCTACPLCRFMALLRGERPEATARLVDGALMIIRTLRSMVPEPGDPAAAHQHPHSHGQHHPPNAPAPTAHPPYPAHPPPGRRTGLEHINIL